MADQFLRVACLGGYGEEVEEVGGLGGELEGGNGDGL